MHENRHNPDPGRTVAPILTGYPITGRPVFFRLKEETRRKAAKTCPQQRIAAGELMEVSPGPQPLAAAGNKAGPGRTVAPIRPRAAPFPIKIQKAQAAQKATRAHRRRKKYKKPLQFPFLWIIVARGKGREQNRGTEHGELNTGSGPDQQRSGPGPA